MSKVQRLNACELEIDLFCRGMRLSDDASPLGARPVLETRRGLGSGLEVVIPANSRLKDEIWVNVPVAEGFARRSPYRLTATASGGHEIVDERHAARYEIRVPPEPSWYTRLTSSDMPMSRVGVLQGTYLAIDVNPACAFWSGSSALSCRFCTTGRNAGANESAVKELPDVIETCRAAKEESGVTFVHLNGGFQRGRGLEFVKPYVAAIKENVGLLVGVQLAPERDFSRYDELVSLGVDHFSFCLELMDPQWFARTCPGKALVHGQWLYFDALKYCASMMPLGSVSGDIIAGIEPVDRTIEAIDRIATVGAFPTVSIFRPTIGSDMEDWPSPAYDEMRRVMAHVYEACRRQWMPIGSAPNLEGSLVVTPDDAALLAPRNSAFYMYEAFRRSLRLAARPTFWRRMRVH